MNILNCFFVVCGFIFSSTNVLAETKDVFSLAVEKQYSEICNHKTQSLSTTQLEELLKNSSSQQCFIYKVQRFADPKAASSKVIDDYNGPITMAVVLTDPGPNQEMKSLKIRFRDVPMCLYAHGELVKVAYFLKASASDKHSSPLAEAFHNPIKAFETTDRTVILEFTHHLLTYVAVRDFHMIDARSGISTFSCGDFTE